MLCKPQCNSSMPFLDHSTPQVGAAWLSEALRAANLLGDDEITAVEWQPIGTGQVGDSARFTLTYDRPGAGPATLAGKFPAEDATSRQTAVTHGLYAKEVSFYRELAGELLRRGIESRVISMEDEWPLEALVTHTNEELRQAKTPIPENDVGIAALARQHALPLLSRDAHFDCVAGVRRIGW